MEDTTIQQRQTRPPHRPESISSRGTRHTLSNSSNNSSSTHLPSRNQKGRESGGSSMLQERLRERKVESARQSRRQSLDLAAIDDRAPHSSPANPSSSRDDRRPSSSGISSAPSKRTMGVKQVEEQVSTLHKQNFDLKLELYHRRERQEKLEARLEAAEAKLAEQEELQEVNDQLLSELEKRDQAVEEAVGIICDLEEKVERLMEEREIVRRFDAQNEAGYFSANHEDGPASSPPSLTPPEDSYSNPSSGNGKTGKTGKTGNRLPRMPSFLSEKSDGAEALKSLYNPTDRGYSGSSLPKLLEDNSTADGRNSPRLSELSESSFLSVYGKKPLSPDSSDGHDEVEEASPPRRHRASSSVEKWVDERPVKSIASLRPAAASRSVSSTRKSQLLSINSVLESPLQRLERGEHRLEKLRMKIEKRNESSTPTPDNRAERSTNTEEKRKSRETMRRKTSDKDNFDNQPLPPTPDTVSTSTLRHYKNSNDTLHDVNRQVDGSEALYLTGTSKFPVPAATHNAYQSMLSVRPRSAGETINSRREGHGWDTETQDDLTETGSISSTGSTYHPTQPAPRKDAILPDLFSFGVGDGRTWARDVMFNIESARLPAHKPERSDHHGRSSRAEPRNDVPMTPDHNSHPGLQRARYYSGSTQYSTSPIDTSPRPDPPARRSSLSAATKLRKAPPSASQSRRESSQGETASPPSKDGKLSRFTGLFSRSLTSPAINGKFPRQESSTSSSANTDDLGRSQGSGDGGMIVNRYRGDYPRSQSQAGGPPPPNHYYEEDDRDPDRATPPPIARSRTSQAYIRPSSAGTGAVRKETMVVTAFGGDGSNDRKSVDVEGGAENETNGKNAGGGRKWLGRLSRTGSLNKRT